MDEYLTWKETGIKRDTVLDYLNMCGRTSKGIKFEIKYDMKDNLQYDGKYYLVSIAKTKDIGVVFDKAIKAIVIMIANSGGIEITGEYIEGLKDTLIELLLGECTINQIRSNKYINKYYNIFSAASTLMQVKQDIFIYIEGERASEKLNEVALGVITAMNLHSLVSGTAKDRYYGLLDNVQENYNTQVIAGNRNKSSVYGNSTVITYGGTYTDKISDLVKGSIMKRIYNTEKYIDSDYIDMVVSIMQRIFTYGLDNAHHKQCRFKSYQINEKLYTYADYSLGLFVKNKSIWG